MTNFQNNNPPLGSKTNNGAVDWPQLLWREWRHCHDQEYAAYLYKFLIKEPLSRSAATLIIALTILVAGITGLLLTCLFAPENWGWSLALPGFIGGAAVVMILFLIRPKERLSWATWLRVLTPHWPLINPQPDKPWEALWWVWLLGLTSGLGVGWTGAILFDQPRLVIWGMVMIPVVGLAIFFFLGAYPWGKIGLIVGVSLLGLLFGLNFGVGFAQLVGLTFGTLDVTASSRMVGWSVGLVVGLLLGRQTGLIGTLLYLAVVALITFINGPGETLLAWLVGMVSSGLIGSFSYLWLSSNEPPTFDRVYPYRFGFLWWFNRPPTPQVEAALMAQDKHIALLERLEEQRRQAQPPEYYLSHLDDPKWRARFIARHGLISLGTASLPELEQVIRNPSSTKTLRRIGIWLVRSIGWDTTQQLAHQSEQLLCRRCLTICAAHQATFIRPAVTYYGCRTCQQSTEFFQAPAGIVAILDHHWDDQHQAEAGLLRINALARQELFDFDRIEIIRATDEAVERFAVQIGNDTDPFRKGRYPKMVCRIDPDCPLSENTRRILERTFGKVEIMLPQKDSFINFQT